MNRSLPCHQLLFVKFMKVHTCINYKGLKGKKSKREGSRKKITKNVASTTDDDSTSDEETNIQSVYCTSI